MCTTNTRALFSKHLKVTNLCKNLQSNIEEYIRVYIETHFSSRLVTDNFLRRSQLIFVSQKFPSILLTLGLRSFKWKPDKSLLFKKHID